MNNEVVQAMDLADIHLVFSLLREEYNQWRAPAITKMAEYNSSPFKILISCIISLRTRDEVTAKASQQLFLRAATPESMQLLSVAEIARLIYPSGFYRNKALQISEIVRRLMSEYDGCVPCNIEELLKFKGVGRKTANLVITVGFRKPGICVDAHVHRICNRLGYLSTKTPEKTEMELRTKLPQEYWIEINNLLVAFGQNCCHPVSPRCTICKIGLYCQRVGVKKHR